MPIPAFHIQWRLGAADKGVPSWVFHTVKLGGYKILACGQVDVIKG